VVSRIEIENFKSIQKADIELRPINVLIGANGAGKSNFINFFKLLNKIYGTLTNFVEMPIFDYTEWLSDRKRELS